MKLLKRKIAQEEIKQFESYLENIKKEILWPNWKRKAKCPNKKTSCKYLRICEKIPEKLLEID